MLKEVDKKDGDLTYCPEAEALVLVEQRTHVLSPTFRKLFPLYPDAPYPETNILMERVHGKQLRILWPSLSLWQKLRVVWTVRQYVRQLHSIKDQRSSVPGPLAKSGHPLKPYPCRHILFPFDFDHAFTDIAGLAKFWAKQASYFHAHTTSKFPVDTTAPLVFCHGDLNMRNIMLDTQGHVWIIDYGFSGFYPPWYEYTGMLFAAHKDKPPWLWRLLVPVMSGAYFAHEDWIRKNTAM